MDYGEGFVHSRFSLLCKRAKIIRRLKPFSLQPLPTYGQTHLPFSKSSRSPHSAYSQNLETCRPKLSFNTSPPNNSLITCKYSRMAKRIWCGSSPLDSIPVSPLLHINISRKTISNISNPSIYKRQLHCLSLIHI